MSIIEEYQRKMSADVYSDLYPCSPVDWFSRHKISSLNFQAVSSIISRYHDRSGQLRVLDVGCGNGLWSQGLFDGAEITGIELENRLLHYAKLNSELTSCKFEGVLLGDWINRPGYYDFALSIGVIEFLDKDDLRSHLSIIQTGLREGGYGLLVFSPWRLFSACYLPWIHRGGYVACCKNSGKKISKIQLAEIADHCRGYFLEVLEAGGINPYPSKLWGIAQSCGYVTRNVGLMAWYYQQFLLLRKGAS
jgi:2-polyprenyl-3-methyl-5-hydroxy-6-metoxy-1,4-benzoquinol methylase